MAARKPRRKKAVVTGLTWRDGRAYWQREHDRLPGARPAADGKPARPGRVNKSLQTADAKLATDRAAVLNRTGWERGDWDLIERWVKDEIDITDLIQADREGGWKRLRMVHQDGVPLRVAADVYLAQVEATQSKRTRTMYSSVVERAVKHFGAKKPMHEVTTADAQAYLHADHVGDQKWAPRTMGTQRTVLAALWKLAMEREAEDAERANALPTITYNPWRKVKAPKIRRTRFSYLRPDEARALLEHSAVRGTPTEALLALAIYGGLRLGELANLRTGRDVILGDDWRSSLVIVQSRDGEHAWRPKTERGERKIRPISALYERLKQHAERFAGERYFFRPEGEDKPPHSSTVTLWVQYAFKAAGIRYGRTGEALTLHSLRHTFATWQVSAGIPIPTVAKRMGDTEIVVLRTYAHHMPDADEKADEVLQSAATGDET